MKERPLQRKRPDIQPGVLAEAAEWFALLGSGTVSQNDVNQWQAWLESHPDHRAAWSRVEFFSQKFKDLPPQAASLALNSPALSRRRALKTLAVLSALGVFGFELWRIGDWPAWTADYRTGIGGMRTVVLADGSRIMLDAASAVDVDYSPAQRRLRLLAGEIYIETAADAEGLRRPFVVDSSEGRVRALGTRFSVRQLSGATRTAVYAGAVVITPAAPNTRLQTLTAGQQTRFTDERIETPQTAALQQPPWTQGFLLVDNRPLGEFVVELNRYRQGYVTCAPEIADLRLVGAFPLGDTDRILAELEKTLPVRVSAVTPWWVRIVGRD